MAEIDREVIARFEEFESEGFQIYTGREAETEHWHRPVLYRELYTTDEFQRLGSVFNIDKIDRTLGL